MKKRSIFLFVVLSLLAHLLLVGLGAYFSWLIPTTESPKKPEERDSIEVTLKDRPYQIADIPPPEVEERPDEAKFLGMYDSKAEKETVAPTIPGSSQKTAKKTSHKELSEKLDKNPPGPPKKDGVTATAQKKEPKKTSEAPDNPSSSSGADSESEEPDYFQGVSNDYFPNYQVGDRTFLNVLKYPKVGYFVRLKKIFRMTFNPAPALRESFQATQVSKGQVDVVLGVTVDPAGRLADLMIIHSSNLPLYDQEAVRTIRDSAPFAAPPGEVLKDGVLRMAWTFSVYF